MGPGQWLQALSYGLSKPREIAIIGEPDSADTQALLNAVQNGYRPFQVVALGSPDGVGSSAAVPLLQDRAVSGTAGWASRSLYVPRFHLPGVGYEAGRAAGTGRARLIEYAIPGYRFPSSFAIDH